jgi:GcrA cell cycle regulator
MTFTADHVTQEWRAKLAAQGRQRSIACGWTDERVDLLKKLWADGLSCSQIARSAASPATRSSARSIAWA